jgi:hypothetical protein
MVIRLTAVTTRPVTIPPIAATTAASHGPGPTVGPIRGLAIRPRLRSGAIRHRHDSLRESYDRDVTFHFPYIPTVGRAKQKIDFDRALSDLPAPLRWREYMMRVEAVIFAASQPVSRETLSALIGSDCNLDLLIADIRDELKSRPYELVDVAGGFQHRTRHAYAEVIRASGTVASMGVALTALEKLPPPAPRRIAPHCSPASQVLSMSLTSSPRSSSATASGLSDAALGTVSQGGAGAE